MKVNSRICDIMECPNCGNELDEDNYCDECCQFFDGFDDDSSGFGFDEEPDYDSMVNNGSNICLNCTFWSVSPYGAVYGMVCRKGQLPSGPDDSCGFFVQQHNFANYGDGGQFQFDETGRAIKNKLNHWKNNRY